MMERNRLRATMGWAGVLLVGLFGSCSGSDDDEPVCGNGLLEDGEGCDDGNDGARDGCDLACQVERGWTCIGTECGPACGDGEFVEGVEICDPSYYSWEGYCAANCSAITGRCGDGIFQPEVEECDGGRGCTSGCEAAYGFTCSGAPPTCVASGLPGDRPLNDLTDEELAAFCEWATDTLGGPGRSFECNGGDGYIYTFTVRTVEDCMAHSRDIDYGACTVGEYEDWVADRRHDCGVMFGGDLPCMSG